jgi:glucose repression mediator protein
MAQTPPPNGAAISPAIQTAAAPNGAPAGPTTIINKLNSANEQTWLLIGMHDLLISLPLLKPSGRVAEQMGDLEHALSAYENALRHNPSSVSGLTQVAGIARIKENYPKVNFFSTICTCLVLLCSDVFLSFLGS